jgi:WD40 repeat protein
MSAAATGFYVTGGTLRPDAACYVVRRADAELYEGLSQSQFCYFLTPRQMGKSSLMARTMHRLRQAGVAVAVLDLTAVGQNLTPTQWYDGLLAQIGASLDLEEELEAFWQAHERLGPMQRWMAALRQVVLERVPGSIVLFIDEIDAVRSLPFSTDEFFAGLRECYNRRTEEPEFGRLTFCLLGVASPSDLIRDTRTTPFNIGRRIELSDFTAAEAAPLAAGLTPPPDALPETERGSSAPLSVSGRGRAELLGRVLYWTGGHPYLTQQLCQAVAEDPSVADEGGVDRLCEERFLTPRARERDNNLLFVREHLLRSELDVAALLELYGQVWRGKTVRDEEASPLVSLLRLSGIVRSEGGLLRVRNRIYERVFDGAWVRESMPDAEVRRQRAAYRRGLTRAAAVAAVVVAIVGGLAVIALNQARRADQAAHRETQQKQLAQARERTALQQRYVSQIKAAKQALDAGNSPAVWELLAELRPRTGEEDPRGFEWRLLWSLAYQDDAFAHLQTQMKYLNSVAFSADGRLVATAGNGFGVQLWDVASQRRLASLTGFAGPTWALAFSPDGRLLAAAGLSSWNRELPAAVKLWDVRTRREVALLHGDTDAIDAPSAVGFSPDSRMLALAGGRALILWDVATRRRLLRRELDPEYMFAAAFSPRGGLLATGGHDPAVKLWHLARNGAAPLLQPAGSLPVPGQIVGSVAFSPDGSLLAAGTSAGTVKLWDLSRKVLQATLTPGGAGVIASFSPDGRELATASLDHTIRRWSLTTREEIATLRGHRGPVVSVAYSPVGRTLASADQEGWVKLWATAGARPNLLRGGHTSKIAEVAVSPNGRWLASGSSDRSVTLWEIGSWRRHRLAGGIGENYTLAFSPDSRLLATGDFERTVRLWDVASRRQIATLRGTSVGGGSAERGSPMAFSPDGRFLALKEDDTSVRIWEIGSRRTVATLRAHKEFLAEMEFSADGKTLATPSHDLKLILWDVATWTRRHTFTGHAGWLGEARFSPDGKLLAIQCGDNTIWVWDLETKRRVAILKGHTAQVSSIDFAPDGKSLVSCGVDQTIRFWSTASWRETLSIRDPDLSSWALAFSPDGSRMFTGREDSSVRVWHAQPLGFAEPRIRRLEHKHAVEDAERERRWADAATHLNELVAALPRDADLRWRRGTAFAELGRWTEAREYFHRALGLGVEDMGLRYALALTQRALGDVPGFQQSCREALREFSGFAEPNMDTSLVSLCALTPDSGVDPARLVALARRVLPYGRQNARTQVVLGAALYRARRYTEAVPYLRAASPDAQEAPTARLLLAMTTHAMGRLDEAQRWYDQATRLLDRETTSPDEPAAGTPKPWHERLALELLRREARSLVGRS